MIIFLVCFSLFTILLAIWVVFVRPWARARPGWKWFFDAIEPIEIALWRKSETLLWARFQMLTGILLEFLMLLRGIDLTEVMPYIPEKYRTTVTTTMHVLPLVITILGWINEMLRRDTTKPLPIVELPRIVPKEVKAATAEAAAATAVAVATVEAAKI